MFHKHILLIIKFSSVEVHCFFVRYKWHKNGREFNPSGNDARVVQLPNQGTIVFNEPESKDEAIYQCFADNGYGVSTTIQVNLREAKLSRFPYEQRKVCIKYSCFCWMSLKNFWFVVTQEFFSW